MRLLNCCRILCALFSYISYILRNRKFMWDINEVRQDFKASSTNTSVGHSRSRALQGVKVNQVTEQLLSYLKIVRAETFQFSLVPRCLKREISKSFTLQLQLTRTENKIIISLFRAALAIADP